jgi:hypothetical protein
LARCPPGHAEKTDAFVPARDAPTIPALAAQKKSEKFNRAA